jgi:hypothetical protein
MVFIHDMSKSSIFIIISHCYDFFYNYVIKLTKFIEHVQISDMCPKFFLLL